MNLELGPDPIVKGRRIEVPGWRTRWFVRESESGEHEKASLSKGDFSRLTIIFRLTVLTVLS
jgi:hypothetical protein